MPMVGITTDLVMRAASGSAIASRTIAKAPASATALASDSIAAHSSSRRPCALNEPSALIACGVKPTWPITGIPRWLKNAIVSAMRTPPSSLIAPQPVSFMIRAAHHRLPLQDHHLERDRHGRLQAVHHHAERVADQDEIAMPVDQARGVRVIGGERHDRIAALARPDIRRG